MAGLPPGPRGSCVINTKPSAEVSRGNPVHAGSKLEAVNPLGWRKFWYDHLTRRDRKDESLYGKRRTGTIALGLFREICIRTQQAKAATATTGYATDTTALLNQNVLIPHEPGYPCRPRPPGGGVDWRCCWFLALPPLTTAYRSLPGPFHHDIAPGYRPLPSTSCSDIKITLGGEVDRYFTPVAR